MPAAKAKPKPRPRSAPPSTPAPTAPAAGNTSPAPAGAPAKVKPPRAPATALNGKIFLAALIIVLAGLAAYSNSLRGPFVLDDFASIANNDSIRHGWFAALHPPANGETVMGRPLVNLTFAVNFGFGGLSVEGYHVVNLAIHLLAGLVLFGLVRRTLELPGLREKFGARAVPIALAAALLWTLHPLQTGAVTYLVQRAESLMGLFFLLTFYGFVRAMAAARATAWLALSVGACLLGVFCKEVIVTAPVLVLLFDRALVAGSFAAAIRARRNYYAALAATWLPLAWLVISAGTRGGSAGFGAGASAWRYALTQSRAIIDYLLLAAWPHPLVFDYGSGLATGIGEVAPYILLLFLLLAGVAWLLWKQPRLGFLAAWFFLILAPTSSIVPVATSAVAEYRLYLPLAALAVCAALGLNMHPGRRAFPFALALLATLLGGLTSARNRDYASAFTLWGDTAVKRPDSARAQVNFGGALLARGQYRESIEEFRRALQLQPDYPEAENNLGEALARLDDVDEAALHFAKAATGLRFPREKALAYFNLGNALGQSGRFDEALAAYTRSVQLQPDYAPAHNLRGYVFAKLGQFDQAITEYQSALQLQPVFPPCAANLGDAFAKQSRWAEAAAAYTLALRDLPGFAAAQAGLANARQHLGRPAAPMLSP